jgi:ribosomal protein S18 acetylase RimI-like enzyme
MEIELAMEFWPSLLESIKNLMRQLSPTAAPLTLPELEAIITSPTTHLFIAVDGATLIGMLTLVLVRIPSGLRAHIEDVVVDKPHRGKDYGKALALAAIDLATKSGARTIDLTSRPSRKEAIGLHQALGFTRRDTNVFRLEVGQVMATGAATASKPR